MSDAIGLQCSFFLVSVLWGAILLIIYDVLRILRRIKKHKWFTIGAEDFLFWMLSAFLIFRMMYEQNDGNIRGFSILGMGLGMVLYSNTISPYFVDGVSRFILFIRRQIHKFLSLLYKPFAKLGRFIKHRLCIVGKALVKSGKSLAKPLKKLTNRSKLEEQAKE